MAYINGNEVLFSAQVHIEQTGGGTSKKTYSVSGESVDIKGAESVSAFVSGKTVNLLSNNLISRTASGITATVNADKSITLNGTATAEVDFDLFNATNFPIEARPYYLTGCPAGGGYSTYQLRFNWKNADNAWAARIDNGSGEWFDESGDNGAPYTSSNVVAQIRVFEGATLNNVTFYPMLSFYDGIPYTPYGEAVSVEGESITVTNNGTETQIALSVNSDGTVNNIPIYDDMTLSVAEHLVITASYVVIVGGSTEDLAALEEKVNNNTERIAALEGTSAVASYFEEEVETTIDTIIEKTEGTALVLNIITDTHEDTADSESVRICNESYANIKAVNEGVYCDALIHLGDSCGSGQSLYPDWQIVNKHLHSTRKRLLNCNEHSVMLVGNHDGINSLNPNEKKTYNAMYAYTRDYVKRNGTSPYGYMDFEDRKIRCVFLSTTTYSDYSGYAVLGFGWEQVKWFIDVACKTEDGWQLLVFSHYSPYDTDLEEYYQANLEAKEIVKILNAYTNHTAYSFSNSDVSLSADFTTLTTTKAVAWICGHGHYDRVTTNNTVITDFDLCCPIIQTACARLEQENEIPDDNEDGTADADVITPARTTKTVTQDLWDTLVYRPDENKIYMIRFGAGEDREIEC